MEEDGKDEEAKEDNLFMVPTQAESEWFEEGEEEDLEGDATSEEDCLGLGPMSKEKETVVLSSGEGEGIGRQCNKAKRSSSLQGEVKGLDLF